MNKPFRVAHLLKSIGVRVLGPRFVRRMQIWWHGQKFDEIDIVLQYFSDRNCRSAVMVDVGAHFGSSLGRFASDGWKVHAFEPDDYNRRVLEIRHGHRSNLIINNLAASDSTGGVAEFFTSEVSTGISGLKAFDGSHSASQKVSLIRLDDYCRDAGINQIDFLKIDTEGHDLIVLNGIDLSQIPADVILCEFEDRKTSQRGYDRFDLARHLTERGYHIVISEWFPIQTYGGNHRWRAFRDSMEQTASDSWGNIIAFKRQFPKEIVRSYGDRFSS